MRLQGEIRRMFRCLLAAWFVLGGAGVAGRVCAQTVELKAASDWKPEIRVVIPDVRMCPGEEYDLPVYIETSEPIEIHDFTLGFRFPDHLVVEPVNGGIVTDICDILRDKGTSASNYRETGFANIPDRTFSFNWYTGYENGSLAYVSLTSGQMLFRFRVRCKQEGDAAIELVSRYYPGFGDASQYSHFNVKGVNKGIVIPSFDTAYVRPAAPPVVSALSDTTVCVLSETRLWAEGGVQYYWEDISAVTPAYRPAIAEPRVPNPLFVPKTPGYYTYRVKITSKTGCSAYDTVQYLVLDNGLNLDIPKDTMVDFGGTAVLNASIYGGYPPYTLSWKPVELVQTPVMDGLAPDKPRARVNVENRSLPLQKPQWFTLRVEDRYCALTKRQSVNVAGSDIEAVLTMNPSYVCVGDNLNTAISLSVDARGGVGRYNYHWSVENLEQGKQDPVFETTVDGPTAKLRLFSRCVVHVDVTDWTARKMARFTDTVRFVASSRAAVTIEDLNGSTCEMTEMTFTAKPENEGEHPHYSWRIDGSEVFAGPEPVFKTYLLRAGSVVSCVLTSDKVCVENTVATATHKPNVATPGYITARPSLGEDAVNTACGDSLSLSLLHRHTGSRFRLRWFRNDGEPVSDRYVTSDQPVEAAEATVLSTLPRGGYYDYYTAAVTESDRACLLWDSVVTDRIYPRLEPKQAAQAGAVYLHPDDAAGVCTGRSFMVYARSIRNLPSQFRLVWYVKKPGADAGVAMGYYATGSRFADNAAYGRNLGSASEFAAENDYLRIQNWLMKGFPLSLSTETAAFDGDSLYYRLETAGGCAPSVDLTSARTVLKLEPSVMTGPVSYFRPDTLPKEFCEGVSRRFYPIQPATDDIQYTWFVDGVPVNETHPDWLAGDTLTLHIHNGLKIKLRAYSSQKCLHPSLSRVAETESTISGMYDGFLPRGMKDTALCADAPVKLWATGLPFRFSEGIRPPAETSGVPEWIYNYEKEVTVEWAESRADALAGRFIHKGMIFETAVDSARFGDRSGDLHKDSAVVGTQVFVARLTSKRGCMGYDSIRVTVDYHRRPTVVVVPEPAFPWCDGMEGPYFRLDGTFWGEHPEIYMGVGGIWKEVKRPDSVPYEPALYKRGVPFYAALMSSMRTCDRMQEAYSDSMYTELRGLSLAWLRQGDGTPQSEMSPIVCVGDELRVESFGGTMEELQALSGQQLSVDEIIGRLEGGYEYRWTDGETGAVVSTDRILKTALDHAKTYRLRVWDTAHRCPAVMVDAPVRMAVETGVNLRFADAMSGKEVPFSICEGSMATRMVWRAFPQNFSGKAYMGFSVMTAESGYTKARQSWVVRRPDSVLTAWFQPGDRLVYGYFHDTLSCSGAVYVMDSVDLQEGRPASPTFRAGPDTLLCTHAEARLDVKGAVRRTDALLPGVPSLKAMLTAQGVPGAADLPEDGMAETGALSAGAALAYWWPQKGLVNAAEKTSLTPLVSPEDKDIYRVWAYNEYGCIQSDSVRVERFDGEDIEFKLMLAAADSVLCDTETLSLTLDRQQSSILTLFDSLVWRRVRPVAGGTATTEVLAVNTDRMDVAVSHGDTIYVDGFVRGDGLCVEIDAAWHQSNKIVVKSFHRPTLTLRQVEAAACADSVLELRATSEAAFVQWLPVDAPDKGYEVLERGSEEAHTAWARVRTFHDFMPRATAYDHPGCAAMDSIAVTVIQTLDTLHLALSELAQVCDGEPVSVSVAGMRNVETWQWRLNGAYMTFEDFDSESVMSEFLLGKLERFSGRFAAGDRIWAEGSSTARCVHNPLVMSDTVTVTRGHSPVLTWEAPEVMADGGPGGVAVRTMHACSGETVPLRLRVSLADTLYAVWYEGTARTEWQPVLAGTADGERIYEMTAVYPGAPGVSAGGVLHLGAMYDGCASRDSLRLVGWPHDTLTIEAAASARSVCEGEEVHYGLLRHDRMDSVVWYVNDRPVLSGNLGTAIEYVYRPASGDRVYAAGYKKGMCVFNNGLRSNVLSVEVLDGGAAVPILAALKAEADSVCGPAAVAYTVDGRGFDSVYWYVNGQLSAVTDLLSGVTTAPEMRTASWKRVPRPAAEGADSVCAVAVRRERVCALRDSLRTNIVSVYRREVPVVTIAPRDTTVTPDATLTFSASGASAYVWWTDAEYGIAGTGESFMWTGTSDTVQVSVMGYEPAYDAGGLAAGEVAAPAPDAYEAFGCYAYDSVRVRPGGSVNQSLFIPNAVLVNSARPADRVFKVFGEEIASVHMRIYNGGGDMIFEKTGDNPVWRPGNAAEPGNYAYRLVILLQNGEIIKKNGWISVLE